MLSFVGFCGIIYHTATGITIAGTFFTSALYLVLQWLKLTFPCQTKDIHLAHSWGRTLSLYLTCDREWDSILTSFFLIVYLKAIYMLLLLVQFIYNSTEALKTPDMYHLIHAQIILKMRDGEIISKYLRDFCEINK